MTNLLEYLRKENHHGSAHAESLLRFSNAVLEGLALHAIEAGPAEYQLFRDQMRALSSQLGEKHDPVEILVLAGAVNQCIDTYNRYLSRSFRQQGQEYVTMVTMLTQTVTYLNSGTETATQRFHEIERQLEQASSTGDIRAVRSQLSECLDMIRQEKERQQHDSALAAASLKETLDHSSARLNDAGAAPEVDRCTGLPGRRSAEKAIRESIAAKRHAYAALFVLERWQLINSRYGGSVGDQMLVRMKEEIAGHSAPGDKYFRWSGPAVLALIDRIDPASTIRAGMQRLFSQKQDESFLVGTRSVMLPLSCSNTLVPLFDGITAVDAVAKLDNCLSLNSASVAQSRDSDRA